MKNDFVIAEPTLTKKQEEEIQETYLACWDSYLRGDAGAYSDFVADHCQLIGTTLAEVFGTKAAIVEYVKKSADQLRGKVELRNREIKMSVLDSMVLVQEFSDLYIKPESSWVFYSKLRLSTVVKKTVEGWKFIFQHGSMPDTQVKEGETLAMEQIRKENSELREAVNRRTFELQTKNRELEIEASLEKVRASASGMHKPGDLLAICEILFNELQTLGFADLRNAMINVHDDARSCYQNYDYSGYAGATITKIAYDSLPVIANSVQKIRETPDAFSEFVITGKDLEEWKIFRRKNGEKDDPRMETNTALYYYFYSIGTGAIGISTFSSADAEKLIVLKRFRNVFVFAYKRYLDVVQAEMQAREAKIEVALERVRTRTMAMQKSEELTGTSELLFQQFKEFGAIADQISIAIVNEEDRTLEIFATFQGNKLEQVQKASLDDQPVVRKIFEQFKAGCKSTSAEIEAEELKQFNLWRNKTGQTNLYTAPENDAKRWIINAAFFSKGVLTFGSREPVDEETIRLLERFAGVFDLTYTRFLDLKNAEAQAKLAQTEVAMERVRGRALAMQQPEELIEVAQVLRQEMGLLGLEEIESGTIFIFDATSDSAQFGFTMKDTRTPGKAGITENLVVKLNTTEAGKELLQFFNSEDIRRSLHQEGAARKEWVQYLYSLSPRINGYFGDIPQDKTYHLHKFSNGAVGASSSGDISEVSWDLLQRAASVFSLAYSRFRDLTKARHDLQQLIEEKKRSDSLLLNILPEEIANELKQFGKSYARKHEEVTILFADIKGFSTLAENLSAEQLVTQLDECFRAFDNIVEKHGLEKIKTVGDAYVCACGLPKPVPDNAARAVRAAQDMMEFIKGFSITKKIQNLPAFEFRVGIHTGPVVTGVVGLKKFTYDIWGDAVNMAARMEQHGEVGKINISGSTYQFIKDKFTCTHRGKIEAKNKGEVDMYFVE